jgi:hypothetical protein
VHPPITHTLLSLTAVPAVVVGPIARPASEEFVLCREPSAERL